MTGLAAEACYPGATGLLMLRTCIFAGSLALAAGASAGDRWEPLDGDALTANQLAHGAEQLHDLAANAGVADEDWFRIAVPARSSVEIVVDGVASTVGSDS